MSLAASSRLSQENPDEQEDSMDEESRARTTRTGLTVVAA
jgi:hypothetical protein